VRIFPEGVAGLVGSDEGWLSPGGPAAVRNSPRAGEAPATSSKQTENRIRSNAASAKFASLDHSGPAMSGARIKTTPTEASDMANPTYPLSTPARRRMLKLAFGGGLAASVPLSGVGAQTSGTTAPPPRLPAAEPAEPIVDARFPHEIAPGVFIFPDKRIPLVPNIGVVVGRETALVVDCGLGPASAEGVLATARRLAPGRRLVLTITHAHPEHGFGAQAFRSDARIWYNRAQADYLSRAGNRLLEGFRTAVLPPGHRHLLSSVELVPPEQTYDGDRATLDLGGRRVEFRTWGTAHSPGDQIVHLPDERIVFGGDMIEERMFPIVPLFPPLITADEMDVRRWEVALAEIARMEPRLVVPGHGNIGGPEVVTAVLDYFREVRGLVEGGGVTGAALEERVRASRPTWEQSQFIAPTIRYFSSERR
jgi:glyoxylase-like metal-dependent hydrolase (beta-lactamase superfamily II)